MIDSNLTDLIHRPASMLSNTYYTYTDVIYVIYEWWRYYKTIIAVNLTQGLIGLVQRLNALLQWEWVAKMEWLEWNRCKSEDLLVDY